MKERVDRWTLPVARSLNISLQDRTSALVAWGEGTGPSFPILLVLNEYWNSRYPNRDARERMLAMAAQAYLWRLWRRISVLHSDV